MNDAGYYFAPYICISAYPIQNTITPETEITEIWYNNGYTQLSNKAISTTPTISISISTLTQAITFYI